MVQLAWPRLISSHPSITWRSGYGEYDGGLGLRLSTRNIAYPASSPLLMAIATVTVVVAVGWLAIAICYRYDHHSMYPICSLSRLSSQSGLVKSPLARFLRGLLRLSPGARGHT